MKKDWADVRALLDVSVLVALAWESHQFHGTARSWMEKNKNSGWATCAITELGFIRLSSQASIFGEHAKTPAQARDLLAQFREDEHHQFFAELPSTGECEELSRVFGPNKVTDAYLIGLARFHRSKLVTFDKRLASLATSERHIEVLLPAIRGL
jgi:toxin-antitoxin system PIN domain toxin